MLGKIEGRRRKGRQRTRWSDSITNAMDMNLSKLQDIVKDRRARQLNNNILLTKFCLLILRKYQQLLFLFYIYICVYICMYVCVCIYVFSVCMHTQTQTQIHTYSYVLNWPKCSFRVFCKVLEKNANKLFGQPNISMVWACSVRLFATHGPQYPRLLCPWDHPGKNTGAGCHFLLQGIFQTQESNPCLLHLLHWQADSLPLRHLGSPYQLPEIK